MVVRRRDLFLLPLAATVAKLHAADSAIRLGYDTYSLRDWGWTAFQHIDFAAQHKLDTIQISSFSDQIPSDPKDLRKIRDAAHEKGITLEYAAACICPTSKSYEAKNGAAVDYLANSLRIAHALGARTLASSLGNIDDRYDGKGIEFHIESTIKVLKAARSLAMDLDVKIAVENHSGDMQAWELKELIEAAGKDYVGAVLDTGNPIWVVEHPEVTMEVLGPYASTTHCRDTVLWEHPRGCAAQWTALGEGNIDMVRIAALHKQLCPRTPLLLEIITGRVPRVVPYRESAFWKGFPKARAAEFARFLKLVKQGGPLMTPMVILSGNREVPEYRGALKRQQLVDLERSLEYAKRRMI